MVNWYLGTMGFGYKDWSGVFYPAGTETRDYLTYYSRKFNASEVDSTFYGAPRESVIQRWVAVTPPDFKFCLKTPQEITHNLSSTGVLTEMSSFLQVVKGIGDKLGAVLIQFPPSFRFEQFGVLSNFLASIATDQDVISSMRFAVEFRHRSWHASSEAVKTLLEKYHISWASTEYPGLPKQIYHSAPFLYIRWIGQHGSYVRHDHERIDKSSQLSWWWEQLRDNLSQVSEIYGFFNNDYAGFAPGTCNRFKSIAGLPFSSIESAQQGKLF